MLLFLLHWTERVTRATFPKSSAPLNPLMAPPYIFLACVTHSYLRAIGPAAVFQAI